MPRFSGVKHRVAAAAAFVLILLAATSCGGRQRHDSPSAELSRLLTALDKEQERRDERIAGRQLHIDSLRAELFVRPSDLSLIESLAEAYTRFNNDSAIALLTRGYNQATADENAEAATRFLLLRASRLTLGGFIPEALDDYASVDTARLSPGLRRLYFYSGKEMLDNISNIYTAFPGARVSYERLRNEAERRLIEFLPEGSPERAYHSAESMVHSGELPLAHAQLRSLTDTLEPSHPLYSQATHLLARVDLELDSADSYLCNLARSALSDAQLATLEVMSLQELGEQVYYMGDTERSHRYISWAFANAVEAGAMTSMLETAQALPIIQSVHDERLRRSRNVLGIALIVMSLTVASLGIGIYLYRRKIRIERRLQVHLKENNRVKEMYISQFLGLCSSYMDKLNQFNRMVERKLSAGKADELLELSKSGKFVDNQSKEFYEVFDSAFLHIYPDFIANVNRLMQPEHQFTTRDTLNTDLRILAFMRMGLDDSGRIADILNYSVNTIYTYRNKLKNWAISRSTFENDIRNC